MNPKWLAVVARLLRELAIDDIDGHGHEPFDRRTWSPPTDWTTDDRDEFTRAVELWDGGPRGDHYRTTFRFLVAGFLADRLEADSAAAV
jgi:hypothetical protein